MIQNYRNYYYQGYALYSQGNYLEAKKYFEIAIQENPRFSPAYNELGNIYKDNHDFINALKFYKKALNYMPQSAIILTNLGVTENQLGKIGQAQKYFKKAIMFDPKYADAYYNIGKIYLMAEKWQEAKEYFEKALKTNPAFGYAQSLLALTKMQTCDWNKALKYDPMCDTPLLNLLRLEDPEINLKVAQLRSATIEKKMVGFPKFVHRKRKKKKLIVGYMSNDFYNHATSYLIAGMFELHDRKKFAVYIYSYGPNDENYYLRKVKKDCDKFTDISKLGDYEAAQKIYSDGVDILVDLKGYTGGSRMEILALRPAPIQISYLGFPGTTGSNFIDYIITDKVVSPPSHKKYYSEKFAYMPNCYQINYDKRKIADIEYKRSDFNLPATSKSGLAGRSVVFSCFNHTSKIDPETFTSWMRILKAVPKSVLWLFRSNKIAEENLKKEAKKAGINPNRLIFATYLENSRHLARIKLSDLALDTFTYNGHTTTSDSLWAGVPVVTLQGKHFASRVASSILTAAGLPELITHSQKEYEDLAISLALNPQKLNAIRYSLLSNRLTCPLFDTQLFFKNLEKLYLDIYEQKFRRSEKI